MECLGDGDCHLIVHDPEEGKLYEMYKANVSAQAFTGGCLAVWDTRKAYDETLRGDQCASADAAGLPIAPLLFTADEVAAGEIAHAIRFVLPNDRLARGFVRPAVHGTDTTGPASAPTYGVHLRLKANYPVESLPKEGARVVARALQKYGMVHADGGEVALTAASDRYTTAKWADLLDDDDLEMLKVTDFEIVDHGDVITYPYRCTR
jgi:serine/threonine-protein kinase